MYLRGRSPQLRKSYRRLNLGRIAVLFALIMGGVIVTWLNEEAGAVPDLFVPTPGPTRNPRSYAEEAEAQFSAGHLQEAVAAYQEATRLDTGNLDYRVATARIQIYAREYEAALDSAEDALLLGPNSAKAKAVYAWALDWNVTSGCHCRDLGEAAAMAVQAIALDGNYAPAHAYYSEILNDSGKWDQGAREAELALSLDPNSLDALRSMGYANESVGAYGQAIEYYRRALAVNPNLVTLYMSLGINYRALQPPAYDQAIAAFSKANSIDPFDVEPLLALSKTNYQVDNLGTAVQYLEQALELEPNNPDIYGRLGMIFHRQKNYEDALPALEVAVFGQASLPVSNPEITPTAGPTPTPWAIEESGLPLTDGQAKEYYYTLATLYASLSTPWNNMCAKSLALIQQLLAKFPDDPTVQSIAEDSFVTCSGLEASLRATATPDLTLTPAP
jgi:tetratricopeptide (TPR) repeat protein